MIRPIFNIINISNLRNNFLLIRKLSLNKKVWIVIKSNAYGNGIENIYKILSIYNIDGFAVLTIDEAICLRDLGYKNSILLLEGYFDLEELKLCFELNITVVIHSYWQIKLLKKINVNKKINVYLKLNSDLNRLGFNFLNFKRIFYILKFIFIIKNISLMIHLSKYKKNIYFDDFYKNIFNFKFKNISIYSSSSLIWNIKMLKTNWVRIGILLYGSSPTGNFIDISKYGFKPVVTFQSKIIDIKIVKKGQFIGYNNSFYSNKDRIIGIVSCGYADGYPRCLSNNFFVLINYKFKAKILGYISMDIMIVDLLDNYFGIKIGDDVELWGENLHIDYVAKFANTVSYQLMCSVNFNRVKFLLK